MCQLVFKMLRDFIAGLPLKSAFLFYVGLLTIFTERLPSMGTLYNVLVSICVLMKSLLVAVCSPNGKKCNGNEPQWSIMIVR